MQRKIINKAVDNIDKLSTWETEFIDSMNDKDDDYELSDKQNSVLNRIQDKVY